MNNEIVDLFIYKLQIFLFLPENSFEELQLIIIPEFQIFLSHVFIKQSTYLYPSSNYFFKALKCTFSTPRDVLELHYIDDINAETSEYTSEDEHFGIRCWQLKRRL